ncbi:MAG: glutathione S-transferase family protein [Reyranellaceae bacterium]
MPLVLHAYRYSVYARIVRAVLAVLAEKALPYEQVEVDPFAPDRDPGYLTLHPFGRVPVLVHDGFALYETSAITRYLDRVFPQPTLQPSDPQAAARMDQIIGVVDSYGYWPLVRQVFSHGVFRPAAGLAGDAQEVAQGLVAARTVLAALDGLAGSGPYLVGSQPSLADFHLGSMLAYFTQVAEAAALLDAYPRLSRAWRALVQRPSFQATEPGLPGAR